MVEGKVCDEWNRTSMIACILANSNRDPKKSKAFTMSDFHPLLKSKTDDVIHDNKEGFRQLKKLFTKDNPEVIKGNRIVEE